MFFWIGLYVVTGTLITAWIMNTETYDKVFHQTVAEGRITSATQVSVEIQVMCGLTLFWPLVVIFLIYGIWKELIS